MCWAEQVGVDTPRVKDPNLLRLDMITGGERSSKMSERCEASCGVNPKICGPQMYKHMGFD